MPRIPILTTLLAAGLALPGSATEIQLEPCHLRGVAAAALCGRHEVFENRRERRGRTIPIAIAVLPARQRSHAPEPLVILAGGPGQAARDYAPWVDRLFHDLRRTHDIVLIDARGTGGSGPLRCAPPNSGPAQPTSLDDPVLDAAECRRRIDADVRWYANEEIAGDLDEVLDGLGYGRVNLWGASFGTRTALVFTRLFPARVRTVVLDSATPFELSFPAHLAADTERALDRLVDDCARDRPCAAAYPSLGDDLERLRRELDRAPRSTSLADPTSGTPRQVTVDRRFLVSSIRVALYSPLDASVLPLAITRAAAGDYAPLAALASRLSRVSVDTMALGATLAVVCTEDVRRIPAGDGSSPDTLVGSMMVDDWRAMCHAWPAGEPPDVTPRRLPVPALILSGELDPVTPPRWGEAMARSFSDATHVVVAGAAHNAGLTGCAPQLTARFVAAGSAAGLDIDCAARGVRPPFVIDPTGPRP